MQNSKQSSSIELSFRDLNESEVKEFRKWARNNYIVGSNIPIIWHPIVRDECEKINKEHIHKTKKKQ